MQYPIQLTNITLSVKSLLGPSPLRKGFFLIALALAGFALSSAAQAVSPPPEEGYLGSNTAENKDALFSLITGISNTATGFDALFSNTTGYFNMANVSYVTVPVRWESSRKRTSTAP